jgi:HEAT repeat protein
MSAKGLWTPGQEDQHRFLSLIANESTDREVVFWSLYALEQARLTDDAIIKRLSDPSGRVRSKAAELVRESLDLRALEPLIRMLKHPNEHEWYTAIHTLGALPDVRAVQVLWEQLVVSSPEQAWAYVGALARSPAPEAIEFLRKGLEHPDLNIRGAIAHEFVIGRDARQTQLLLALHDDPDEELRQISTEAFAMMCSDEVDRRFLSQYVNGEESWLDPRVPIDDARVGFVAEKLKLSLEGVRRRYEALAGRFPLHLTWMPRTSSEINDSSRH